MLNLPMSSVRKATVTTSEGNLAEFLLRSERKLRHAIPDGNCLFRSLSINLYNHQEEHLAIRKLLVKFEELNKDQFANYLTASDASNIDDHICSMVKPFVWGTQVELLAASSFFQVPLYYAPVNVIPQYPLCGDTGGFDIYSNQISHHRGNLFGSNPCNIVRMRSVKSPHLCQIPHPPGRV